MRVTGVLTGVGMAWWLSLGGVDPIRLAIATASMFCAGWLAAGLLSRDRQDGA